MSTIAPSFSKKPGLRQEDNGNKLILECEILGAPKPTVNWLLGEMPVKESTRVFSNISPGSAANTYAAKLEINNVTTDDAGTYKVKAKNKLGEVTASINLNFSSSDTQNNAGGIPPTYVMKPSIKQEDGGKILIFECQVMAEPKAETKWFKDEKELKIGGRITAETKPLENNVYIEKLTIKNVEQSDAGQYRATAINQFGESNASINLNFDVQDEKDNKKNKTAKKPGKKMAGSGSGGGNAPNFVGRPEIRQLENSLLFVVKLTASPLPNFAWQFNGKDFKPAANNTQQMISDGKVHTLLFEIKNPKETNFGEYKLTAKNKSGEAVCTINVNGMVGDRPDGMAPKFTKKPEVVVDGKTLKIVIEATAIPIPSFIWLKNGTELKDKKCSTTVECKSNDTFVVTLNIDNYSAVDAGQYSCVLANEWGSCVANVKLQMIGGKRPTLARIEQAPFFTDKPKIDFNEKKKIVTLSARVKAKPKPSIEWTKNNKKITEKKGKYALSIKEEKGEFVLSLIVSDFKKDDGGKYRLKAKNDYGEAIGNLFVEVEAEEEQIIPIFKEQLPESKNFNDGDTLMLSCEVSGVPKPTCQWYYNKKTIKPSEDVRVTYDGKMAKLEIEDACVEDTGKYTCEASNPKGKASSACQVTIVDDVKDVNDEKKKQPEKKKAPTGPEEKDGIEPEPKIIPPTISLPDDYETEGPKRPQKKKNSIQSNSGHGSDAPKDYASLPKPESPMKPTILDKPANCSVVEGRDASVIFQINGNPFPRVVWSKGGRDLTLGVRYFIDVEEDTGKVILTLKKTKFDDESKYQVRLLNENGEEDSAIFSIFVLEKDSDLDSQARRESLRQVDSNALNVRRDSKSTRRNSLAEAIPDWPELRKPKVQRKVAATFVKELEDKFTKEAGPAVVFKCEFSKVGGKLRWYKDKNEIFHGFKFHLSNEGGKYMLVINKIVPEDEGKYTCKINDISTAAYLTVEALPPKYEFTKVMPARLECFRTKGTIMECFINNSDARVKWYKNSIPLVADPHLVVHKDYSRCFIRLTRAKKEDEAEYSCQIINEDNTLGEISKCALFIEEPQFKLVKRLPPSVSTKEKDTCVLEVEVEDDNADVEWLRDGINLANDPLYEIVSEGKIRKLIMKQAQRKDTACKFEARTGAVSTSTILTVTPICEIVKPLEDIEGMEESDVVLELEVTDTNFKPKWFRSGVPISSMDEKYSIRTSGNKQQLIIHNSTMQDGGEYSVQIEDKKSKCNIKMKECEKKPKVDMTKVPTKISVKAGKPLEISVPYDGFPIPKGRWKKNGNEFPEKIELRKVEMSVGPKDANLMLPKTKRADGGTYELILANQSGEVKVPIEVVVIDRPEAPEGPIKTSNITKDSTVLSWNAPKDDGGSPLTQYIIERCDASRGSWTEAGRTSPNETNYKVKGLSEKKEYLFRVRACNDQGISEPLETKTPMLAKNPYDEPGAPGTPEVIDWDADHIDLQWKSPTDDGGAEITGYVIEKREKGAPNWSKGVESLSTSTRGRVPNLIENKEYEFRVRAVNKAGHGKPSEASASTIAKPRYVRPRLDKMSMKPIVVKAGQTININTTFFAEPEPEASWKRADVLLAADDRTSMSSNEKNAKLTITNAKRSDTNIYYLTLTNSSGHETGTVDVTVLSKPNIPGGPLKVQEVFANRCEIQWKAPADDGGVPIKNYIVEKRNVSKGGSWEPVSDVRPTSTSCPINRLKEGDEYEFRVIAENTEGVSEPLITEAATEAKNPFVEPDAPMTPECIGRDRSFIEVSWDPPRNDGGAPIKGYVIERREVTKKKSAEQPVAESPVRVGGRKKQLKPRPSKEDKWVRLSRDQLLREPNYMDNNVREGKEYDYRVIAINEAGESPPSKGSGLIPAKPEHEKPFFIDPGLFGKELRVKAGEPIDIELPIDGSPIPEVEWFKDGEPIKVGDRASLSSDEEKAKLHVPRASKDDMGKYKCILKNSSGEAEIEIPVVVLDKPGKCEGPLEVKETTKNSAKLQWKPPKQTGGAEVTDYVIEKCLEGTSDWVPCHAIVKPSGSNMQTAEVKNLEMNKAYKFRVSAENIFGVGEPIETAKEVVVKPPYDPPSAPSQPEVVEYGPRNIKLKWEKPNNDGGSPIEGYTVEMKDKHGREWQPVTSYPCSGTDYNVTGLQENNVYEFRVKAINDAGPGSPSKPSEPQTAETPVFPADAPDQPRLDEITKDSVSLSWHKPLSDGGSPITEYVIEKKTRGDGAKGWEKVAEIPADTKLPIGQSIKGTVHGLPEKENCQFRVRAKTDKAGLGEPSKATEYVVIEDQPTPPEFLDVDAMKDIVVRAGQDFEMHIPFKAVPKPITEWTNNDDEITQDDRVHINFDDNCAHLTTQGAKRSDSGLYKLKLKNRLGENVAIVKVKVLDSPSAPEGPLKVSEMDAESCKLTWDAPKEDGGDDLFTYLVEKREKDSDKWVKAAPLQHGTAAPIKGLDEGTAYEFRVIAQNQYGQSEPLVIDEPVTAEWPFKRPESCGVPTCNEHTEDTISLTWEKPVRDGGSPITGYVVEKKKKGDRDWQKASHGEILDNHYTVKNLQDGTDYDFRVAAVNKAGTGKWKETEESIRAAPADCPPQINMDSRNMELRVKEGEVMKIRVPYSGSPVPNAAYSKDGETLLSNDRCKLEVVPNQSPIPGNPGGDASITIPNCQTEDEGIYNVVLRNDLGSDSVTIHVTVVGAPSSPQGPLEVHNMTGDSCTLEWQTPKDVHGAPVTNYVVEKQNCQTGKWEKVSSFVRTPSCDVLGLEKGKPYKFRVSAENEFGVSQPLELDQPVDAIPPWKKPDPPRQLEIDNQTPTSVALSWMRPKEDGGVKIQGYIVEFTEAGKDMWEEATPYLVRDTNYDVDGLKPNKEYDFRVKCKNQMGFSKPSLDTVSAKLKPDCVPPSSPGTPEVGEIGKNFVELKWTPPNRDGGKKIKGYIVEKKPTDGSGDWVQATDYPVVGDSVTLDNLPENSEWEFRIKAVNKAGQGEPSSSTGKIKIKKPIKGTIPEFVKKPESASIPVNRAAEFECEFTMNPVGECRWYKNDMQISDGGKYKITSTGTKGKLTIPEVWETDDSSALKCVLVNDIGKEECEFKLSVIVPPKLDRLSQDYSVGEGETLKVKIPFSSKTPVNVDLRKDGEKLPIDGDKVKAVIGDDCIVLLIKDVEHEDSGRIQLNVGNNSGTNDVSFNLKVQAKPLQPQGPIDVNDITKDSCRLQWRAPKDDGRARVSHYTVEKHDKSKPEDQWITVNPACKDTNITIPHLYEDHQYDFRICAVNPHGVSEPLCTTEAVTIKLPFNAPESPSGLIANDVGGDFVTLSWEKPKSDGGGGINGYVIERREIPVDDEGNDIPDNPKQWIRCNKNLSLPTIYNVTNLTENCKYEFRVMAENEAGLSEPCTIGLGVVVRDPNASISPKFIRTLENVQGIAGKTATFEVQVSGNPKPEVHWYRGSKEVYDSPKYKFSRDGDTYRLHIHDVQPEDEDQYVIRATNVGGSKMSRADLHIQIAPKIKVPERFTEPYIVQKGETIKIKLPYVASPKVKSEWKKDDSPVSFQPGHTIQDLSPRSVTLTIKDAKVEDSGEYIVNLQNCLGSDTATINVRVLDAPDAPTDIKVEKVLDDCVRLAWIPPVNDGGSPIYAYVVEKKEVPKGITEDESKTNNKYEVGWVRAGLATSNTYNVEALVPLRTYKFRVSAENAYGRSPPSKSSPHVTTKEDEIIRSRRAPYGEDSEGRKKRGRDDQVPSDYDRLQHNLSDRWRPTNVEPKEATVYDYYDIFEELGKGPFGATHRGVEKASGKNFAVKFIPTNSPAEKAMVRNEIALMNQMRHPGCLQLYDCFDHGDEIVIVTEMPTGKSLMDGLADASRKMTEAEARKYIKQVLEAVKDLHEHSICHLDINPDAFVFNSNKSDQLKLVDFSLASKLDPDDIVKISTANAEFAAPEIIDQDSVGFYTDMWATGALAYTMLSGASPFYSDNEEDMKNNIRRAAPSFPSNNFGNISDNCKDFIQKLLCKGKGDRLTVHQALDHPWFNVPDDDISSMSIPNSHYDDLRHRLNKKYDEWAPYRIGIGRSSLFSWLKRLRMKEFSLYPSYFDRREAAPRIVVRPRDKNVKENETADFFCIIVAASPAVVSWYRDDLEVKQSTKFMKKYSNNNFTLLIKRTSLDDKGEYQVRAINSFGEREATVFLNVEPIERVEEKRENESWRSTRSRPPQDMMFDLWREPDSKPIFTFLLRPRLIQEGVGFKLICCISGKPAPKISWYKGAKEITGSDARYQTSLSAGVATLEVNNASLEDIGNYKCKAVNELGEDETSCHVNVEQDPIKLIKPKSLLSEDNSSYSYSKEEIKTEDGTMIKTESYSSHTFSSDDPIEKEEVEPEPPVITTAVEDKHNVKLGSSNITFTSYFKSPNNKHTKVEWYHNGEIIQSSMKNYKIISSANNNSWSTSLTVQSVMEEVEGEYSLKVTNDDGMKVCKANLSLKSGSSAKQLDDIPKTETEIQSAITEQTDAEIQPGTNDKQPETDDVQPKKTDDIKPEITDGEQPEKIDGEQPEKIIDEQPKKIDDEKRAEAKKEPEPVVANEKEEPPKFSQHLTSRTINEGEEMILSCVVTGNPTPEIVWLRNDKEVPDNPDFKRVHNGNEYQLIVNEVFPEDTGVFSCEAYNPIGALMSSCIINIKALDAPDFDPGFITYPTSLTVEEATPISFDCEFSGSAPFSVKWYHEARELDPEDPDIRLQFIKQSEGKFSLKIPAALATDGGQYHILCSNKEGVEISAAFSLHVNIIE
ncbi:hypothetical protein SNEBB_010472 [Seison nebaliae]|nr:hypothetical protein SNEBB_010472 [Seison nebaliae]